MKLPGWIIMERDYSADNPAAVRYRVRVRKWHPGYWREVLRAMRSLTVTIKLGRRGDG